MLAFWVELFQYFLSVSPQEWLGRLDLNRWILEAQERRISGCSTHADAGMLTAAEAPCKRASHSRDLRSAPSAQRDQRQPHRRIDAHRA